MLSKIQKTPHPAMSTLPFSVNMFYEIEDQ